MGLIDRAGVCVELKIGDHWRKLTGMLTQGASSFRKGQDPEATYMTLMFHMDSALEFIQVYKKRFDTGLPVRIPFIESEGVIEKTNMEAMMGRNSIRFVLLLVRYPRNG